MSTREQGRERETGVGAAILGLILALVVFSAKAEFKIAQEPQFRLEVGFGQSRFQKPPEGMWRQEGEENAARYKDNHSSEIGLAWKLTDRVGMTLRLANIGHVQMNALNATCPEDNCNLLDKSALHRPECLTKDLQNCLTRWVGGGGIHGVGLGFNTELARLGNFSLDGELGAFVYTMNWIERVYPINCANNCAWSRFDAHESGLYVSPMGSVTLRWKYLFIATRIYARTTQHTDMSPGYRGYTQTVIFGGSFPL